MSEMRISDPSQLHLKKELTQIRKARVLRDPGTTSSWKSPLSSTRSVADASAWKNFENESKRFSGNSQLNPQYSLPSGNFNNNGNGKKVFLYNWKNHKSSSEKSAMAKNDADDEDDEDDVGNDGSSSLLGSFEDSLSDARNGSDAKCDTYLGGVSRSSIFRCRDANLVSLGTPTAKRTMDGKKTSKKSNTHLDILSRYRQREITVGRNLVNSKTLLKGHPTMALSRDDSVEQSEDTEDYSNSEDLRRISGASPLLLKLKHKNWSRSSSKLLINSLKGDDSYCYSTPALSTSSYKMYFRRNPSTIGSWDGTTTSMNDDDDEVDDHLDLPGSQVCGIPCYWSKRMPKYRGSCASCYSPSLSDTLRRKGSSILCGSQTIYPRHRRSSSGPNTCKVASRSAQGVLPLLSSDGRVGSSLGTGRSDDELSTIFGELDLEALSRLDGRRWSSSCRSQEGLEIVAFSGEGDEEGTSENIRSFSQKYKPMFFGELIGQNIVVQSLINAISRGRIAPVYLFQGPRGTGKTSTARIFAAALNCLAPDESRPCGYCRECTDFISGKNKDLLEVDGTNKKGIDRVRYLLKKLSTGSSSASSRYMVFVIDECHLLPSKTWLTFLKFLEDPPPRVVFNFITTDLDNVPRTIQSRSQKYLFNKIKDADIIARLRKISAGENLDVELGALDLIALNADGSLRDAETMLEQLSLLGKRITTSLVNELVGVVSDEKLLELLELAMSSNTAETVKRARELMDSGVDPMVLMSQLASLIMDIIAGTYNVIDAKLDDTFIGGQSLTESELERLKHALKLLSEAEKQLRASSERSTWFTATLLQLGSMPSPDFSHSGSSRRQSFKTTDDDPSSASREASSCKQMSDARYVNLKSTSPASLRKEVNDKLYNIWARCIERCHSKTLRQLLHTHGKLVSICEVEGVLVAYVAFINGDIKLRVERFLSSITNSMEMVLRHNVEVRIIHLPDGEASANGVNPVNIQEGLKHAESAIASEKELKSGHPNGADGCSNFSPLLNGNFQSAPDSSDLLAEDTAQTSGAGEQRQEIPMLRIESVICEQRLETAWLQAVEKGTPGSLSHLRPEKNQVLPQDSIYCKDQMESIDSTRFSSQHWEDELNNELKVLKVSNGGVLEKDQIGRRFDSCPMSPSLLHDSSLAANSSKDNVVYESGSGTGGCSGFLCWNNSKPIKSGKVKITPVRPRKGGHFLLFGECGKSGKNEIRLRR
ncbi:protein STICHEL [Quillaja saponaria]|uniref:Protein STICHEL n=1 Tax=Quillaja saponaria TaxID=32244 RepID=A0AAD7PUI6_QUISA|nr:protein STICHEL [Quillaja saponaria]